MKVAVIGSRSCEVDIAEYLPEDTTEIISGGAMGIDSCAKMYAKAHGIKYTEFLPDYKKNGRQAPILRNIEIVDYADLVLAFWDGESSGTKFVIGRCIKTGKKIRVFRKADGIF